MDLLGHQHVSPEVEPVCGTCRFNRLEHPAPRPNARQKRLPAVAGERHGVGAPRLIEASAVLPMGPDPIAVVGVHGIHSAYTVRTFRNKASIPQYFQRTCAKLSAIPNDGTVWM